MPQIPIDPTADKPKLPPLKDVPKGQRRNCEDWLKSYLKLSEQLESPDIFHIYTGLFTLSAALGRKTLLNKGAYKLYPNVYIVLVAGSALCRKTTAIDFGVRILKMAMPDLPLVAQKISQEMLLSTLAKQFKEVGRSEAIIVAEEMGVFLGSDVRNIPLVQLLTKLYNCSDYLDYATIGRGNEVCQNSHCVMLAGTTPEWLHTAFPKQSAEGGFTGRCLFVYADKPRDRNAFPQIDQELLVQLATDLRIISDLEGAFTLDADGMAWYKNWYEHDFQVKTDDVKMDGYYGRKHDTLLKVAMLLSVAKKNDLLLTSIDLSAALEYVESQEETLKAAMQAVHTTEIGANLAQVLRNIQSGGLLGISHSRLLRNLSYKMSSSEIKEHIDTLRSSNVVEQSVLMGPGGKNEMWYCPIKVVENESKESEAEQ